MSDHSDVVDALRHEAGDDLRVVAPYDETGYELLYIREDVEPKIETVAEDVHQELILSGLGKAHLENIFRSGELHCSMHRFDEVTAFHFVKEETAGLFVSLESDTDIPLASFADTCEDQLQNF